MNIMGIGIHVSEHLAVAGDPKPVKRTLVERLTETPWRPWKSHKWVSQMVPDPDLYVFNAPDGSPQTIVGHPDTIAKLKEYGE